MDVLHGGTIRPQKPRCGVVHSASGPVDVLFGVGLNFIVALTIQLRHYRKVGLVICLFDMLIITNYFYLRRSTQVYKWHFLFFFLKTSQ